MKTKMIKNYFIQDEKSGLFMILIYMTIVSPENGWYKVANIINWIN